MRTAKKIFYGICLLILLICIIVLALAMNPDWSDKLSAFLYGEGGPVSEEEVTPSPDETPMPDDEVNSEDTSSVITPQPLETRVPAVTEDEVEEEKEQVKLNSFTLQMQCPTVQITTYTEPITISQTIPETMAELVGYVPVVSTMKEITQSEADALTEELSIGEDGGLLVFDQNFYPYYHMLEGAEREIYRQVYANAFALNDRFKPCQKIYSTQINRVMEAVFNDHPVLFWVDTAYGCKYDPDGKCVEITLQFNNASQKLEQSKTTFEERAEEILKVARTLESDYEKEKYVHDKLLAKVAYNKSAAMNQSAYSALVNGQTVCAGYARAYQYLMQQLGIPCYYCTGYSGENHAWNIVKLHGEYYNVDVTWDDTTPHTYDYFNCSDADLAATHVRRGLSVKLPACTGSLYGGLEGQRPEEEGDKETTLSPAVDKYYETMIERVEKMGLGSVTYTDVLAAETWFELDEAYSNGKLDFSKSEMFRAMQKTGATYCEIIISPEVLTENAYSVTCKISLK